MSLVFRGQALQKHLWIGKKKKRKAVGLAISGLDNKLAVPTFGNS
jgi:hypothetical protein